MTKTHIIILLDNSYSMYSYQQKILQGLNNFIYNLKNNNAKNIFMTIIHSQQN